MVNAYKSDHINQIAWETFCALVQNNVLKHLLEVLLLGLQAHRLQKTNVGLFRHIKTLSMEEVSSQEILTITNLSLQLS